MDQLNQFIVFLQKSPMNMVLLATVIISGALLIWPVIARLMRPGQEIGPAEAVTLINRRDAVVLDVRDAAEYKSGHITNARNVPEGELEARAKELEKVKTKPIIVSDGRGNRSAAIATKLRKLGFAEVVSLRGGLAAWQKDNMPLEKS
ncbi:MAG TPA: rhodanese-like domain-containing protein [Burkholderiales bacterium]|nr:rhodanese-like domain-containing protein [Burkholderiales bacterium]